MAVRVGINGFGRIGRQVLRAYFESGYSDLFEIVAVNDVSNPAASIHLFKYDSTYGPFQRDMSTTENSLIIDGKSIQTLSQRDPAQLGWGDLGVDLVIESTGHFTEAAKARAHIEAGAKKVLISAPGKHEDVTLVLGVNEDQYDPAKHEIISNASCTTNCLAPVAKVIDDEFGLAEGLMTTVHAVTASQPTQDGPSKKDFRGGRNAYQNIIPASTGAAKAVALCLPQLKGKLTGMSFRVPTVDVSAVDLTFKTNKATSLDAISAAMKKCAEGAMKGVLEYTDDEVVSSDFIGHPASSIYDAGAGIQLNDHFFKIVSWYDNEWGYSNRCLDMLRYMASRES